MGVDIVNIIGIKFCFTKSPLDGTRSAACFGVGFGYCISIKAAA